MSILIQCSKHMRTAYNLSRHRINNTLVSNANPHISPKTPPETNNGSISHRSLNILQNRSFFSSTIQCSSTNKIDNYIKKLDLDLRRMGRISKQEIENILNEIKTSKTATPSQSLMILRCCGNLVPNELPENRTILAKEIWKTLNYIGVPLDISHYNTLLKVYLENDYQFSPTEFLEDLEKQGIAPNRVTFQHFISSYCQNGDIAGASRILEYMRDKQLPINKIVFNSLIMGHSQNGDMESAEGVFNVMKESNLEPSSDTYTLLACGYSKKGDIAKVIESLDACDSKELYLSVKDYFDIVYSLAINGHGNDIEQVLTRIPKTSGYNQDAINCIFKLITAGQEEIAFTVFETMAKPLKTDGTSPPIGRFLIGHLIKVNCSLDKIVGFCNKLVSEGTNSKAFNIAAEMALKNESVDTALGIFQYMKENKQLIRQHYFWPLFVAKSKLNDLEGLKELLSIMVNDYDLNINIDTLRFYVLPTMLKNNISGTQIINDLQLIGVSTGTTTHALVLSYLSENNIRQAADIAATHRAFFLPSLIRRPLVNAFLAKNDMISLIVLLQQICNGFSRYSLVVSPELAKNEKFNSSANTEEQVVEMREFLGQVANSIIQNLKQNPGVVQIAQELLENMYEKGLGISVSASEQIQNHLQGKITFEISTLLENLTDVNLVRKTELSVKSGSYIYSNVNETTLENIIKKIESNGETNNSAKRQLLNLYCKNKNLEKATEMKNKLEAEGFKIPDGSMVLLLDMYLNCGKLAEAKEILQELKTSNPEFVLDKYKIIKMTESIAKNESIESALDFLSSTKKFDDNNEFTSFQHSNVCWKLLNTIAEHGSVENVQKMFDLIINNNYITVSNVLLGPLIKVYIVNNDIKGALEKFEWCCKTYRCTPWKNELALKFIESEDATSLQILTDLSTTVHGEVNSLYDLIFAFVECGRTKQARKILETPGLRTRQDRINAACAKYGSNEEEQCLIRLLEITKDIVSFDRTKIFNELLQLYSKNNKVEESMALWTQMQEENTQPSDHFMWSLKELLVKNNLDVPFSVKKPNNRDFSSVPSNINNSLSTELDLCLKNNNVTKAVSLRNNMYSKGININSLSESNIIELLIKENKLNKAFEIAKDMLDNGKPITKKILYFLINKLSEVGDIASLEYLNEKISKGFSYKINFNSKLYKAYQVKGNFDELLTHIETQIDKRIDEPSKLSEIMKNVPGGSLVNYLTTSPSNVQIIERLHSKVSPQGYKLFANTLWTYFLLNKEFDKAFNIAKELENEKFFQYRHVLIDIRKNNNIELGHKFLEMLPTFKNLNRDSTSGLIYSAIIDSYVNQGNFVEASNQLDKALETVSLENINKTAVLRLKSGLEAQGQTIKYDVNLFKKKNVFKNPEVHSDSSDSSDDEKAAKV